MIPDSIPFVLLILTIFAFPIWWGRSAPQEEQQ